MRLERTTIEAAVARYRFLCAAGELHWAACQQAAADYRLSADLLHHNVQAAGGLTAGPGGAS